VGRNGVKWNIVVSLTESNFSSIRATPNNPVFYRVYLENPLIYFFGPDERIILQHIQTCQSIKRRFGGQNIC